MNITTLPPQQLRQAADVQEKILELQDELNQLLGAPAQDAALAAGPTTETPRKYKFSPAARARMRAAQKARWAKIKGTAPSIEPAAEPKKQLSEAKLRALAKARAARLAKGWAAKSTQAEAADKAVQEKPRKKRKMSAAWRRALERAWAARRAKGKA